jgi:hypothetical protein
MHIYLSMKSASPCIQLNTNNEINRNISIIIFNIHSFNSKTVYLLEVYVHRRIRR